MSDFFYWLGVISWGIILISASVVLIGRVLPDEKPEEEMPYEHPIGH